MDYKLAFYAVLWVIGGTWVAYKRDWYAGRRENGDGSFGDVSVAFSIILAPISIAIALFREFFYYEWQDESEID